MTILLLAAETTPARAAEPFTLEQAIEQALVANEAPKLAALRVEQADALLREAYGQLLPSLTVEGVYTRKPRDVVRNVGGIDSVIQSRDALSGSAVAQVDLFNAQAIPLVRGARRQEKSERFAEAETRRRLAFRVAETYLAVLAARQLVRAAEQRVGYARQMRADADARAGAGLAARTDVSRATVEAAAADLALTQARNTLVKTVYALEYLVAAPLPGPVTAPTAPLVDPATELGQPSRDLGERFDLQTAVWSAEAARFRAQAPWLRYAPSLRAQGMYRVTNEEGLSGSADDWLASLTATWTLYDGGVAAAQARRLSAEADSLSLGVVRLRRTIDYEVDNALADLATARSAVTEATAAVSAAELYQEEITLRYSAGLASGLEQADASLSAFQAHTALVQRELDWWLAQLSLRAALGHSPINTITVEEPR